MFRKIRSILAGILVLAMCLQITPFAGNISGFTDVPSTHWAYSSIVYVVNRGYMGETDDGVFEPDAIANRGMIITALYRLAGQPSVTATEKPFTDVDLGVWYSNPIIWAKSIGIINGHDDGTFRPYDNMPREQIALIMYRYADYKGYDLSTNGANVGEFPDFFDTPSGCQTAMKWAIRKGMFVGRDGYLLPNASARRSELATCLHRFETNDAAVSGISFKNNTKDVFGAWSGYLQATISPANAGNKTVYWSSSDESVVKVDFNTGLVTTTGVGTAVIVARTSDGGYTARCTVSVNGPEVLIDLVGRGLMHSTDVKYTDEEDGFFLSKKSIGEILHDGGVTYLLCETGPLTSLEIYDDWYIFAVPKNNGYTYGLVKLREQETDSTPGVTVSFIEFDPAKLYNCLDGLNDEEMDVYRTELEAHIADVVQKDYINKFAHNVSLYNYFVSAQSKGSYLIVNEYVNYIGSMASDGTIQVPSVYNTNASTEVQNAVEQNNEDAGYEVVYSDDSGKKYIQIRNPRNLTKHEKYAIMMTHTANINYYSFAAEVMIHARGLTNDVATIFAYNKVIRADMSIDTNRTEFEEFFEQLFGYDNYNDLESYEIAIQMEYHNEDDWL